MKLKIVRDYLDYEKGKTYNIDSPDNAKYMISMGIAKEHVSKDGEKVEAHPTKKATTKTATKAKVKVEKTETKPVPKSEIPQGEALAGTDTQTLENAEHIETKAADESKEFQNNAETPAINDPENTDPDDEFSLF